MDLKAFIAESIRQIIAGVEEAQNQASEGGALVNPGNHHFENPDTKRIVVVVPGRGNDRRPVQVVEFDVAVVVTRESQTKAEGGVGIVSVVSVGGSHEAGITRETTSRLKFDVPIVLPLHKGTELFKPRPAQPAR
jgi:hypothetical protein